MEALIQHLGHDDASRLSKADLIGWRDALKAAGTSNNTWNNRHSLISQVLKRAEADGLIPFNPADRLRLPKAKPESPAPFSDAQCERQCVGRSQKLCTLSSQNLTGTVGRTAPFGASH